MYENEKKALQQAFAVPPPCGKRAFFKQNRRAGITMFKFWRIQAAYIHKWVWAVSIVIGVGAVGGTNFVRTEMVWIIAALLPFVALATVTETARSAFYGMEELEMAARFSLKSVFLARMGVLGGANAVLLVLLVLLCRQQDGIGMLRAGSCFLTPYLLTTLLSFQAVRKMHSGEAEYACLGISAGVSAVFLALKSGGHNWYQNSPVFVWFMAAAVLAVLMKREIGRTIRLTEEYVWN